MQEVTQAEAVLADIEAAHNQYQAKVDEWERAKENVKLAKAEMEAAHARLLWNVLDYMTSLASIPKIRETAIDAPPGPG